MDKAWDMCCSRGGLGHSAQILQQSPGTLPQTGPQWVGEGL